MSKRKGPMQQESKTGFDDKKSPEHSEALQQEDILKAVEAGDVKSLKELLER